MSMVNPTNFYYENKKQANIQYNQDVPADSTVFAATSIGNSSQGYNMLSISCKQETTKTYDWGMVKVEQVSQTIDTETDGTDIQWLPDIITYSQTPSVLTKIQFTPYKNLVNNRIKVYLHLNLRTRAVNNEQVIQNDECYVTTNQNWLQYMGQANWNQVNKNLEIRDEIRSSENGFAYSLETQGMFYTITNTAQNIDTSTQFQVSIDPNKTNYIFIFSYLIGMTADDESAIPVVLYTGNAQAITVENPMLNIVGEYINANLQYEVIDLPGIMFDVLTMPFTFISIAFNLTLFPYTPYQINISNLFLSIIAALIFVMIIKKILGR